MSTTCLKTVAPRLRTACIAKLLTLLLLALPTVVQAQFTFTTNTDGSLNIYQYAGSDSDVIIPDTTNGLPITSIGDVAFYNCTNLTSVTIPDSVTSIGDSAFGGCTSLTSITIPSSVTNIGDFAFNGAGLSSMTIPDSMTSIGGGVFWYCFALTNVTIPNSVTSIGSEAFEYSGLTSVTIPDSVTNIGIYVFDNCTNLTAITVDALNPVYNSMDGILFNQTTLIQCPARKAGSCTIPNGITSIGIDAFQQCTSLTNVTIPNSVTSIERRAFASCTSLTSVTIPNSVTNIGFEAFMQCYSLTSITIPNSLTSIYSRAFASCFNLTEVYFQGNTPIIIALGGIILIFSGDTNAIVYHLPGTTGWGATTYGGAPSVLWNPHARSDASFGVRTNRFGFNIVGPTNVPIVIEACADLANPVWVPLQSCTLTNGSSYFSDPQWTNYLSRFYRFRSP